MAPARRRPSGSSRPTTVTPARRDSAQRAAAQPLRVRWALSRRAGVTVVGLDDPEGRRLAGAMGPRAYAYSDGRPQADLTAKDVRLREERLEFVAMAGGELARVRVRMGETPRLYDHLAALAGALALGVPLADAAARLSGD